MHPKNNFDFLRLVFASFVIITHAYPLSGLQECDWLKGFFVISGYLIFQSMERSRSWIDYFWKRFLRLFPALFAVLLLTIVLAPFLYTGTISYWHNKTVWTYIPSNLSLYFMQYSIDGVLADNPYPSAINGNLWTITYEFTMYVFLSFLIFFRQTEKIVKWLVVIGFAFLVIANTFFVESLGKYHYLLSAKELLELGGFFMAGAVLAVLRIEKSKYHLPVFLLALSLIIVGIYFDFFQQIKLISFPIAVIILAVNPLPYINAIGDKIGDVSYGIYIFSFPVQQVLMHYFRLNHIELMLYGFLISFVLGFISWHIIEKRALQLKKKKPFGIFAAN
jgi:peptidoglycan/LPS O-acetylase OafA/YrhL